MISDAIKESAPLEAVSINPPIHSPKKVTICPERNTVSIINANYSDGDHSSNADKYESVKITFADNCRTIFVRPAEGKDNTDYLSTIKSCRKKADEARSLDAVPTVGLILLAPYEGEFFRAQVTKILPERRIAQVEFIDFGNIERVPFDELKPLDRSMQFRKRIPYEITLAGIDDNAMYTESGVKYLKDLSDKLVSLLKLESDHTDNEYHLIDEQTGESVNEKLAKLLNWNSALSYLRPIDHLLTIRLPNENQTKL